MTFRSFICYRHNELVKDDQGCRSCLAMWETLPDAKTMAPEDRLAELDAIVRQLTVPFSKAHKRIEELVGRPVFVHEIGMAYEQLRTECLWIKQGRPVDVDAAIALFEQDGKPIFVVEADDDAPERR